MFVMMQKNQSSQHFRLLFPQALMLLGLGKPNFIRLKMLLWQPTQQLLDYFIRY
jgi:hypothetical protein